MKSVFEKFISCDVAQILHAAQLWNKTKSSNVVKGMWETRKANLKPQLSQKNTMEQSKKIKVAKKVIK